MTDHIAIAEPTAVEAVREYQRIWADGSLRERENFYQLIDNAEQYAIAEVRDATILDVQAVAVLLRLCSFIADAAPNDDRSMARERIALAWGELCRDHPEWLATLWDAEVVAEALPEWKAMVSE